MNGDAPIRLDEDESGELPKLANGALKDALGLVDSFSKEGWNDCGCDGDVRLHSKHVGANLPMFLGQLRVPQAQASLAEIAAVLLSDACRQFWDPSYLTSHLLCTCGEGNRCAVLCTEQRPSPVSSEALWTNVCTARYACEERAERLTYAATSVPSAFRKRHEATIGTWGEYKKELITKIWAIDVQHTVDEVQVSFLLLTEASSFRLPNFMLKQVLASWLGVCVKSIWRMASSGMTPKRNVCLTSAADDETETIVLNSRQLKVSGAAIIQLASENGRG